MDTINVSVVIVNWNTEDLLHKCLKSIKDNTSGVRYEIIVIDNNSADGSTEMMKREFPDCKLIESRENLGFAKGNNRALKEASGEYILFLNPDTELITNALYGMFKFLENKPEYGAVGCKLLNEDGSIQFTCARKFPTPFNQFCFLSLLDRLFPKTEFFSSSEMSYWDHCGSRNIDCLSGACIMARKTIIDWIGGFSEDYFMYGEDVDLCYAIKTSGWLIYYLTDEQIYHYSGASSSQINDKSFSAVLQRDSNQIFMKKNYNTMKAIEYRVSVFLGSLIRVIVIATFLPFVVIRKSYSINLYKYSLKKYFNLILWSLRMKSTQINVKYL